MRFLPFSSADSNAIYANILDIKACNLVSISQVACFEIGFNTAAKSCVPTQQMLCVTSDTYANSKTTHIFFSSKD